MITLCAVPRGFEDWVSIEDFGNEHEGRLRTFLELPNGISSHDTLSEVMGRIDKAAFSQAFAAWVQDALPSLAACRVALDGECLRGSAGGSQGAAHLMSAFAAEARLVRGAQAVADKSNEIGVVPIGIGRRHRDHRCHGLPEIGGLGHCWEKSRLRAGAQGQPSQLA